MGSGQGQHAARRRCDDLQEGQDPRPVRPVRRPDPDPRHPRRDQARLLAHWLRPLRSLRLPRHQVRLQGRQGDRQQEDGGPPLAQVERDGPGHLRAAADVPSAIEVTGQLQATRAGQYYYSERVARPMSPDTICDLGALWLAGGTTVPQTVRPEYYPWREPYSIGLDMH